MVVYRFAVAGVLCAVVACGIGGVAAGARPLIIDTDIGTDFDDSAALALALSSPDDFDVKLVLSATGDTTRRAQIVARYLDLYDRTDVPVGVGVNTTLRAGPLWGWAETYPLSAYPGPVYTDGVGAAIKIIQESSETVLIAAIAPANNFPSLLKRCPECAAKVQVVAMSGSIYRGYGNSSSPNVEYNVGTCISCSQEMYATKWAAPMVVTPLDTCGVAVLYGDAYASLLNGTSVISAVLSQSLMFWATHNDQDLRQHSDIWYDPVAIYLAMNEHPDIVLTSLNVVVNDQGMTVVDSTGLQVEEALNWINYNQGVNPWQTFVASRVAAGTDTAEL